MDEEIYWAAPILIQFPLNISAEICKPPPFLRSLLLWKSDVWNICKAEVDGHLEFPTTPLISKGDIIPKKEREVKGFPSKNFLQLNNPFAAN